jgi:hypothetical protein
MVPWGVDQRPLPEGADVDSLAPRAVGPFARTSASSPTATIDGSVYVEYRSGAATIFMEIGMTSQPSHAHAAVATAAGEMTPSFPADPRYGSMGTEPTYFGHADTNGAFFAWTRQGYFFSAHAKGGYADLDAFMGAFPF